MPPPGLSGGPPRGKGHGGPPPDGAGRWSLALFHTVKLRDDILVRPGLASLDLLDGDAIGANVGSVRHTVELDGGCALKSMGLRLSGRFESGSRVRGGVGPQGMPGSDLTFSSLLTLDARVFVNFDIRKALVEALSWLSGSRHRLSIENLKGAVRKVRDASGAVPLAYQPGYLDPRGPFVELSFRKQF